MLASTMTSSRSYIVSEKLPASLEDCKHAPGNRLYRAVFVVLRLRTLGDMKFVW